MVFTRGRWGIGGLIEGRGRNSGQGRVKWIGRFGGLDARQEDGRFAGWCRKCGGLGGDMMMKKPLSERYLIVYPSEPSHLCLGGAFTT